MIRAEIVNKTETVNDKGQIIGGSSSFSFLNFVRLSSIMPFSSKNASDVFGFNIESTHKANDWDKKVKANDFIRYDGSIYYVKQVASYPRMNVLVLEKEEN